VCQGGKRSLLIGRQEQPCLEESLKAVANAEDEPAGVAETVQGIPQEMAELDGQDLAGGHIISIRKAAGHDQDLKLLQTLGLFAEAVDVDALGHGPGLLAGELGFAVAVGPGGAQDKDAGSGHVCDFA
jgi:hypothetical protein